MNKEVLNTPTNKFTTKDGKVPKLTLKEFDTLLTRSIAIVLNEFTDDENIKYYYVSYTLFSSTFKSKDEVPICIDTEIFGPDMMAVAYEAIHHALKIVNSVIGNIIILDEDGENSSELFIGDVLAKFDDKAVTKLIH